MMRDDPVPRLRSDLAAVPTYRPGLPPAVRTGAAAGPLYKLSSNENPYPPLPGVLDAVATAAGTANRYPHVLAAPVAEAVAAKLGVPPGHVVVGAGSVAVLGQLVQAAAGPGDEVVFAWRSFESYPIVTGVAGATAVPVPLAAGGRHDLDAMAAAVTDRTRAVLVCSPNNPTGPAVTKDELERLLDRVPADVLVVLDEAYREFVRDPAAPDGVDAYRDRPNVAVLRTFSKAYGLAGLRVGYAVAHAPVADAIRRTAVPFAVSGVAQAAAIASLAAEAELLDRVGAIVAERERVLAALRAQGHDVPDAQANFVWLALGDRTAAFAEACGAAGLAVRPFDGEGARCTVAEPAANDRLLEVAARFTAKAPARQGRSVLP